MTEWDEPEWEPANAVERGMRDALANQDGAEYARLLRSAQLLVPDAPQPGTEAAEVAAELLPRTAPYIPVFTSPESLAWAFGDLIEHYQSWAYPALMQQWPDALHRLAVNPGSPIGTFLAPQTVTDLAEGRESLVSVEAVEQVMVEEMLSEVRLACLRQLAGGKGDKADRAVTDQPRDDPPANPLEAALRQAVSQQDGDAYLQALFGDDPILLLTAEPVTDPGRIFEDGFPWRVLGPDGTPVIAAFTSEAMLDRAGAGDAPRIEVAFLEVLANWPGEEHMLCVNLGSTLEWMLLGGTVMDLVVSMADAFEALD